MSKQPNIVLVHGAWADGSSWSKVIPILKEAGYNVVATQQNLQSLAEDAETAHRMAASQDGPVLLVGHSYGGAIITEAVHLCNNVIGLVYVAGFGLDKGESLSALASSSPVAPPGAAAFRPDSYGDLWIDRDMYHDNFCQDLDKTEATTMAATQRPLSLAAFGDKATDAGWKNLPSWYSVSSQDRMIPPPAEQFMASRMNATTITLPSSHVAMLSHPQEIADLIISAAEQLATGAPAEKATAAAAE
ncbi:MAG TPA: alpha/beta hydrolase [Puia sp.]|jgi:pimeloyl-ACP methyl ester carboxylesterase|nr:alpha/beta hydrolase [Puia sp.]